MPLEARVKVQLNLKVEQSNIYPTANFRSITFPIMWLEEVRIPPGGRHGLTALGVYDDDVAPILVSDAGRRPETFSRRGPTTMSSSSRNTVEDTRPPMS